MRPLQVRRPLGVVCKKYLYRVQVENMSMAVEIRFKLVSGSFSVVDDPGGFPCQAAGGTPPNLGCGFNRHAGVLMPDVGGTENR